MRRGPNPRQYGSEWCRCAIPSIGQKYAKRIEFLFLNTGDARTEPARQRLGFKFTPHFVLLHPDGTKFREWTGMLTEAELSAGLDELLRARQ